MIRMRPGVPWNVKGIEAEAREMAQLAARRAGVSLGDWLTQVIMTEGRGAPQHQQQHYMPGDGTYGPQPQPQYGPPYQGQVPSLRYPQAFPQQGQAPSYSPAHPHTFQTQPNGAAPPPYPQQPYARDPLAGAAQILDSQVRGSEFAVVAHGLRDMADRLENTERRAQQSIASINQSVAAMQDRIDAAERVKQLADVAFTSAADALAQSARDQSVAFDSLESTMKALHKRLSEVENGRADVLNKDALSRLDTALDQLQKRLNEMRGDVAENDKRSREDLNQISKFIRDVSSRVDATERAMSQQPGGTDAVAARVDALEARAASQFDEMRGALSSLDGKFSQVASKFSEAPVAAIEATLETLTTKMEEADKRAAESVSTVSSVLKSFSSRLEETDKKLVQATQSITRRLDDGERRSSDSAHAVEDALKSLTQRLEVSDKKHKEAIGGLRLTVDGLVAKAASEALPHEPRPTRATTTASQLSASSAFDAPHMPTRDELPPFATTMSQVLTDTPPPFDAGPPPMPPAKDEGEGYSLSALRTIMSGTLSSSTSTPVPDFGKMEAEGDPAFEHDPISFDGAPEESKKGDDYLARVRRAAQAHADAQSEVEQKTGRRLPFGVSGETNGRNVGRLMIVSLAILALVAGIVALLFTFPSGDEETNRPQPGASIGEILNTPGETEPAAAPPVSAPGPSSEFAPLPSAPEAEAAGVASVAIEPGDPSFAPGAPGGAGVQTPVAELQAAAARGDAKAQLLLSLRYSEGRGVEKDDAKALSLVTKAAQQNNVVAEYRLGAIYERGVGVTKDLAQARLWYEKAAKAGSRKAMHNLAVLYADGVGIPQNFPEAARWFRSGAGLGLADSQYNLAVLLERGMGVEKNTSEAAKWYAVAASQGDSGAAERLEALKRTMSPADIALALEAARTFKPKPLDPTANEIPNIAG